MGKYFWNILIATDQWFNALFGGFPDETISSRCAKKRETSKFCAALCWLLDKIDANHSDDSIELDEGLPVEKE